MMLNKNNIDEYLTLLGFNKVGNIYHKVIGSSDDSSIFRYIFESLLNNIDRKNGKTYYDKVEFEVDDYGFWIHFNQFGGNMKRNIKLTGGSYDGLNKELSTILSGDMNTILRDNKLNSIFGNDYDR